MKSFKNVGADTLNKQLLMCCEIVRLNVSVTLGPHNISAMHPSSLIWTWCTQMFTQPLNNALSTSAWMSVSCYFYDVHLRLPLLHLLHFLVYCHLVSDLWLCQLFSMVTTGDSTMSNAGTHCQHFHLTVVIHPSGPGPIVSAALYFSILIALTATTDSEPQLVSGWCQYQHLVLYHCNQCLAHTFQPAILTNQWCCKWWHTKEYQLCVRFSNRGWNQVGPWVHESIDQWSPCTKIKN